MENILETVENGNNPTVENVNNQVNNANASTIDSKLNTNPLGNEGGWKPFVVSSMAAFAGKRVLSSAVLFVAAGWAQDIFWEERGRDLYFQAKTDVTEWVKQGGPENLKKDTIEWLKQGGPFLTAEEAFGRYSVDNNDYPDSPQIDWTQFSESLQPVEQPIQQSVKPVEQPVQAELGQTAQPADQDDNGPIVVLRSPLVDESVNERSQSTNTSSASASDTNSKDWKRSTARLQMFDDLNKRSGENYFDRADRLEYGTQTRAKLNIAPKTPVRPPNQTHMDEHRN